MSGLVDKFREEFKDKETRDIYADDLLNTYIATQIKVLREKNGLTQTALAEKAGMKQERISVLEDVNYEAWTANVLKRIAKVFDLRLSIKFESFGSFLHEFETFGKESLGRPSFDEDPAFHEIPAITNTATAVNLFAHHEPAETSPTVPMASPLEDILLNMFLEGKTQKTESTSGHTGLKNTLSTEPTFEVLPIQSTVTDYTSSKFLF